MFAIVAFNANANGTARAQAHGHQARTGHTLTGYYRVSGGLAELVRTCKCADVTAPATPAPAL